MDTPCCDKKSSHLKAGLAIGAILGVVAGYFLQSKDGKTLTKDAAKKARLLQKRVLQKLEQVQDLSQDKYAEVVDEVLAYYQKAKHLAKTEVPGFRKFLLGRWQEIEEYLKEK